jgi:sulfonate transport system substrate-binding protein
VAVSDPFPAFAPAAEALAAGHIDVGSSGATGVLTALAGNPDLVIFAVERNDNDSQGIVAAAGTDIASIEDLAGHTVAINEGGTGDYLLRKALDEHGMSIDDVEPVNLAPADAATAFSSGQVDAWATWDQYLVSAQVDLGATLVAYAGEFGAQNPSVHVVSRDFADAHPLGVNALYRALVDCADEVVADPSILADAYRDAGVGEAVAQEIIAHRVPTIAPADEEFAAEFAELAEFYAEQGLTDGVVDTSPATADVTTWVEG